MEEVCAKWSMCYGGQAQKKDHKFSLLAVDSTTQNLQPGPQASAVPGLKVRLHQRPALSTQEPVFHHHAVLHALATWAHGCLKALSELSSAPWWPAFLNSLVPKASEGGRGDEGARVSVLL